MTNRLKLVEIRPQINSIKNNAETSAVELFQNNTLRPVLKFQNELLLVFYRDSILKHAPIFHSLTILKQEQFIRESMLKNIPVKNVLIGMIIGHFTIEEYPLYLQAEKELKKRIVEMIIQRLQDQLSFFEQ